MVMMTKRAGALLERLQVDRELPHPPRLELRGEDASLALTMADAHSDDERLYHGDTLVLCVAAPAAAALAGCMLTAEDTPEGTQLAIADAPQPGQTATGSDGRGPTR